MKRYQQEAKTLQVDTVMSLLRGRNTFVLAATGLGKSRIPEMHLDLLAKDCQGQITGVVVVLNCSRARNTLAIATNVTPQSLWLPPTGLDYYYNHMPTNSVLDPLTTKQPAPNYAGCNHLLACFAICRGLPPADLLRSLHVLSRGLCLS
ncbi:hypothetical protein PCASD_06699 [Puccinia coronata f. sp. avenae]|uniref:DEAD/DEAH box helicase domain-containing protein n=1 Tax=Puccinia coronata f. sp. avenae TaxID=200324 RepID=A0A2N5TF46_9BASI|nr:hypothetical protein PCASD_06699 [Puccinia coronata f. sp. avenae]